MEHEGVHSKETYSWGDLHKVSAGKHFSVIIHPENHKLIKKKKEGHFHDETGQRWHFNHEGNKIHFKAHKRHGMEVSVDAHKLLGEEKSFDQFINELDKSTLKSYINNAATHSHWLKHHVKASDLTKSGKEWKKRTLKNRSKGMDKAESRLERGQYNNGIRRTDFKEETIVEDRKEHSEFKEWQKAATRHKSFHRFESQHYGNIHKAYTKTGKEIGQYDVEANKGHTLTESHADWMLKANHNHFQKWKDHATRLGYKVTTASAMADDHPTHYAHDHQGNHRGEFETGKGGHGKGFVLHEDFVVSFPKVKPFNESFVRPVSSTTNQSFGKFKKPETAGNKKYTVHLSGTHNDKEVSHKTTVTAYNRDAAFAHAKVEMKKRYPSSSNISADHIEQHD